MLVWGVDKFVLFVYVVECGDVYLVYLCIGYDY